MKTGIKNRMGWAGIVAVILGVAAQTAHAGAIEAMSVDEVTFEGTKTVYRDTDGQGACPMPHWKKDAWSL